MNATVKIAALAACLAGVAGAVALVDNDGAGERGTLHDYATLDGADATLTWEGGVL